MTGNGPGRRRYSDDQAAEIMRQYNQGTSIRELARKYDANRRTLTTMVSGLNYRDVWLAVQAEGGGTIVEWSPPPQRRNPGPQNTPRQQLTDLIDVLKAHPDQWAHVKTVPRKVNLSWWHKRGLRAELRKMDDGWRVYARWPSEGEP